MRVPPPALVSVLPLLLIAAPAHAAGGFALPEPSSLLLFALGTAGVAIGRRLSAKRPKD